MSLAALGACSVQKEFVACDLKSARQARLLRHIAPVQFINAVAGMALEVVMMLFARHLITGGRARQLHGQEAA